MKLIDILGLKNFRVFNDNEGFLEELSSINILTGANNSGKSSIVKALQMLNNSVKGATYPFDLDLNQQQHLLGDFENILFDKDNRKIEITLPFLFLGMENFSISLSFVIPDLKNTYVAKLRSIEVFDKKDKCILFSFNYREATDPEKKAYKKDYDARLEKYKKEIEDSRKGAGEKFPFNISYAFEPDYNPVVANINWTVNLGKLKSYLTVLNQFYDIYLKSKESWDERRLEEIDQNATNQKLFFKPTAVLNLFKKDLDINKWTVFLDNVIADKQEISGKAHVGENDFDPGDYFPSPEIENILFYKSLEVLRENCDWEDSIDDFNKSVIQHCFQSSWDILIQRISMIKYISNIKEENARGYNSGSNSPFINLLKSYQSGNVSSTFIEKYLRAFEIGSRIIVDYQPKYQLILVSIITMEGKKRELVDFGYGIKQIVLILIQVSVLAEQNRRVEHGYGHDGDEEYLSYVPSLLIIEEPESNLHPKWQSLLADMFAEACRSFNIQLIIETHSEYLIRKFQTLVAKEEVKSGDVQIFYLRSLGNIAAGKKQIESLFIAEDGSIDFNMFDDGFFDENYKLEFSLLNIQFFKNFEDLKDNHQENENKLVELQQNIDDFTSKADVTTYEQIISRQFDIAKLSPTSVAYLVSGQFLLEHINSAGDFSPVIIQYGRAIESELLSIFSTIDPSKRWTIATMQGSLEKFKTGTSAMGTCSASEYLQLQSVLARMFTHPADLEIELINDLRDIRNSAGHSRHTKNSQQAIDYIRNANNFLAKWISEKR